MQEPLQDRRSVVVALNLTDTIQWLPPEWKTQSHAIYNYTLVDIVKMCICDGTEEMQRLRTYLNKTIGFEQMQYICHYVEEELRRAVIDLDSEALLAIIVMPSEPDIPGIIWLRMANPVYRG